VHDRWFRGRQTTQVRGRAWAGGPVGPAVDATASGSRPEGRSVVAKALLRFVAGGLVALLVIGIATVLMAQKSARDLALHDAQTRGRMFARVAAAPVLHVREMAADPRSMESREFDDTMRNRLSDRSIRHIKVWARDGTMVWSDEPGQRGRKYPLEPAIQRLFGTTGTVASMSSLDNGDDADQRDDGPLLEVHVGATSADDVPVVVETYWSSGMIKDNSQALVLRMLPLALGALLLFAVLVLPLAYSLARRVEQAQAERNRLIQHALSASDLERRRIAQDLHDGVMQELSGAGYALAAAASALPHEASASRRIMDQLIVVIKDAGASLRSLLTDIYPSSLMQEGLEVAVAELAARTKEAGIDVTTDIVDLSDVPIEATQLSYRVIREGLRNVRRHAQATRVEVTATRQGSQVFISVADDGRGLRSSVVEDGHLGLRLLTDTLHDLGGTLRLAPRPGGGAVLTATFSLHLGAR
jgi:signal transduction histidine kinase